MTESKVAPAPAEGSRGSQLGPGPQRIRPVPRPGRWIAAAFILVVLAQLVVSLAQNPRVHWDVVGEFLFKDLTIRGLWVTLYLTVIAMVIGIVGGTVLAIMRMSSNPVLRWTSGLYLWVFRGTPLLVQIIFWGYMGALYPSLRLGIPFTDVVFLEGNTSRLISATTAAILALGLNEIAYASEIIRAGIESIDRGQWEASSALGMPSRLTLTRVVLPQAMRVIIPPMGNETITMLKTTSLVSVIAGQDLMTNIQTVYAQNFEVIPLLIVASIWYLAITSILTIGQTHLERRYGRGVNSAVAQSPGSAKRFGGRWLGVAR